MLLEVDGKIVIGENDPFPLRCPHCRRFFFDDSLDVEQVRCPLCLQQSELSQFEVVYVEVASAKVFAAV